MISVDFFGCKREQIVNCTWEDACDRFPCIGITIPDQSAWTSLSEALTGSMALSAELVPLSTGPFYELAHGLTAEIRKAGEEELMDAGTRWAQLPPWGEIDVNPMDLAGFLLQLHSFVNGPGTEENSIFLWMEPGDSPSSQRY